MMGTRNERRIQQKLNEIGARYRSLYAQGQYDKAVSHLRAARATYKLASIAHEEALCLLKMGRVLEAYQLASTHRPAKPVLQYHDIMAAICGRLDRLPEAREHGSAALRLRAEQVSDRPVHSLPAGLPPRFDPNALNIVAFTLFGSDPRYCEVAVMNCRVVSESMPGWLCRFYCDDTVPSAVAERILQAGGEVVMLPDATRAAVPALMWRFLVADDPTVSRYLIRDADSLIGAREIAAVGQWLQSDRWFHIMRDYYTHYELILAGLWGGCRGALPSMEAEIASFLQQDSYKPAHIDQFFLRYRVWPTLKQSVLCHDSQFTTPESTAFPEVAGASDRPIDHIGANLSIRQIGAQVADPGAKAVVWKLAGDDGHEICAYQAAVSDGRWRSYLPLSYIDHIEAGRWRVNWQIVPKA